MFTTKKGKFSCELSLEFLRDLLPSIKEIAKSFGASDEADINTPPEEDTNKQSLSSEEKETKWKTHYLRSEDILVLPLDSFLNGKARDILTRMSEDFIRGNKLEENTSATFVYQELIRMLGSKEFYTREDVDLKEAISFFDTLKETIHTDISSTKLIIIPVLGASLSRGQQCAVGSVEFINKLDFLEQHQVLFEAIRGSEYSKLLDDLEDMCQKSDLIAQIKIKNRDSSIARNAAEEAMKRIYTLIRLILPRIGYEYQFLGTLGEQYLDTRYSFLMKLNDLENVTCITTSRTMNSFSDNEINLLDSVSRYRPGHSDYEEGREWFNRCEFIVSRYINSDKLTDFQKRVWTAIYWFGEAMSEREVNSLIIKYATCLEALFNSREGGISEQISEFTAFICGNSKDERVYIYDNVKNLYKLRSTAVHGGSTGTSVDSRFLWNIQKICETAMVHMSYYSCDEGWLGEKGYQNFIRYILREYRFSSS
ncbi:MAG: HEPN domain-containing protein [Leptolyngbyaceae cyanobacterium bins.349]|nr:HEPN domain-containing protein [Leptolyngbyaceae cyanobacterium bins.349]